MKFSYSLVGEFNQYKHTTIIDTGDIETDVITFNTFIDCNKLKTLNCSGNQLTVLPELSQSLEILNCSNNYLKVLPKLPEELIELWCYDNLLSVLPELPAYLTTCICSRNKLTKLPKLPQYIYNVDCSKNCIVDIDKNKIISMHPRIGHLITWGQRQEFHLPQVII